MAEREIKPWPTQRSVRRGDFRIFQIRQDFKTAPRDGREHDFFVLEASDWVNVVAVTPRNELVMVEQFRHGSETIELEIPGGVMDAEDESPLATAVRELREETGFVGKNARVIGEVFANPAIMSNTHYTVLIEDAECSAETEFDDAEDIAVKLTPLDEAAQLVSAGKIKHSLVVASLYRLDLLRRGV
jgi:8-oxo-dGTP pyrophosphatase MutT (NUDIX family)